MPPGVQKNVRLPEQSAEILRALKYDLDASDGEVVALALERKAVERLGHHASVLKRADLGMVLPPAAAPSRSAVVALAAALNWGGDRYRVEGGEVQNREGGGDWRPGVFAFSDAAQAVVQGAVRLQAELQAPQVSVAVLLLAACESPGADRFTGLGVPVRRLAARLREALAAQAGSGASGAFTPSAKSVVVEGSMGLAALEGAEKVDVEHVLVAALQSGEDVVAQAKQALDIDADGVRAVLCSGAGGLTPEQRDALAAAGKD